MATEADIPESISTTKREREDKDLLGEPLNIEFQELPPYEVKKIKSSSKQPLETAKYVGETISTQLASDIEGEKENSIAKGDAGTAEGEIFFESPSVPKVDTNEASSIPKDYEATKIQHEAEREISEIKTIEEWKPKEEHLEIIPSKEASSDEHSSSTEEKTKASPKDERGGLIEDKELEATTGQNERCMVSSFDLAKVSDMVTEKVSKVCNKEDTTEDSSSAKTASSKENLQGTSYHSGEGKESKISLTLVGREMDVEALKPIEEIEKVEVEQQELQHNGITTQKESSNNQNEEEAIGSGDDANEKIGNPKISALVEEIDSEKAGHDEDRKLMESSSIGSSEKKAETLIEDEVQENEQLPRFFPEKEQEKKNVEGSFAAAFKEMEETASAQPTETVPNFAEQRPIRNVEEILKDEIQEKTIHEHEVNENGSPEAKLQNLPTSDLNEKGESADIEDPIKSANESYLFHQQDDASDIELQKITTNDDKKKSTIDEDVAVKSSEICTDKEADQGNKSIQRSSMEAASELDDRDKSSITDNETESITNQVIDEVVNEDPHENENTEKQTIHKEYDVTGQSPEFTGEETVSYCREDEIEAEKGEEPETSSGSQEVKQQAEVEENRISDQALASTGDDIMAESSKEDEMVIEKPEQDVHEVIESADGAMDIEVKDDSSEEQKEPDMEANQNSEIDGANKETGEQKPEESFNKPELPSSAMGEENDEGNSKEEETDEKPREEVKKLETEFIEQNFEATCHIQDTEARDMDNELNPNMDYNTQSNRGSSLGTQTKEINEDVALSSSVSHVLQNETQDEVLKKAEPTFMGGTVETSIEGAKGDDKKQSESSDLSSEEKGQVNVKPCETDSADVNMIAELAESSNLGENKSIQLSEITKNEAHEAGGKTECEALGGTSNILPDNKDEREIPTGETPVSYISEHIVKEISAPLSRQDNLVTAEVLEATDRAPDNVEESYVNAHSPLTAETEDEKLQQKEDESMDPRDGTQMHSIDKKKDIANEEVLDKEEHLLMATAFNTEKSGSASDVVLSESIETGEVANCSETGELGTLKVEKGLKNELEREKFEVDKPANNASTYDEADTTCRDAKSTPLEQNSTENFRSSLEEDVEMGIVVLEEDERSYSQKYEDPETKSANTVTEENLESVAPYEQLGSAPTSMAEEKSSETFPETSKAKTEEGSDNAKNQNLIATGEKTILFPDRGSAEMITWQDSQEEKSKMNEEVELTLEKREREDKDLLGEPFNKELQKLPPYEVKKIKSSSKQPLETAKYVGETISTQLASDIEGEKENSIAKGDAGTAEGEIFFESPSVPKVATNEASSIPKDYEATKIQNEAEREISEIKPIEEWKPKEEHLEIIPSKEASSDEHSSSTEEKTKASPKDARGGLIEDKELEATTGQNERCMVSSFDLAKVSDMVTEKVSKVCNKEDSTEDSSSAKTASSKENLQGTSYHSGEGKESEISSTLVGTEMDVEALKPIEEIEKVEVEQQELQHNGITTQKESPNNQNEEEAIGSGDDANKKIGNPKISALVEEIDSEKAGHDEDRKLTESSSIGSSEKIAETLIEDEVQENEQLPRFFPEKEQEKKNVEGSFAAAFKEMEETTSAQPTETVPDFAEQRLIGNVEEILKDEIHEKTIHEHEVNENGSPEEKLQNLPTSDLNEKGESTDIEDPIKSANESYLIHQQDDASDIELQKIATNNDKKKSTIDEDVAVKSSEICTDEEADQGNKSIQRSSIEAASELDDRDKSNITDNETESITNQVIDEVVNEGPHENENTEKQTIHKEYDITGQSPEFTGEETVSYCREDEIEAEMGEEPKTSGGSQEVMQQAEVEENRISDQALASTGDDIMAESSKEDEMVIEKPEQDVHEVIQSADGAMDIEVKDDSSEEQKEPDMEASENSEIDGANKETGEQKPEESFNKPELPSSTMGEEKDEGNSKEEETDEKPREEVKKLETEFIEQDVEATCHIQDTEARDLDNELNPNMDYNTQGNRGSSLGTQTKKINEDVALSSYVSHVLQNETQDEVLEKAEPIFMGATEQTSIEGAKGDDKKQSESSDLSSEEKGQVNVKPCETESADVNMIAELAESSNLGENKSIQLSEITKNEAHEAGGKTECEALGGTSNILPDNKDEREIPTGETPVSYISEHIVKEISAPLSRQDNLVTAEVLEATDRAPDNVEESYVNAHSPITAETEDEKLQQKEEESMDPRDGTQMHSIDKKKDIANEEVLDKEEHLLMATAFNTEKSGNASDVVLSESIETGEVANCSETGELGTLKVEKGLKNELEREKFEVDKPANNASTYDEADTTCRDAKSTPLEQNSTENFRSSLEEDVEMGIVVLEEDERSYSQKYEDPETKSANTVTEENLESVAPYEQLGSAPTSMAEEKSSETFPETSKAKTEERSDNAENQNLIATGEKTILFPDRGAAEMITWQDFQEEKSKMNKEVEPTLEVKHQINKTGDRIEKINKCIFTEEVPAGVDQHEESENIKEQIVREEDCITELQMISATDQEPKVVGSDVVAEENLEATGTNEHTETVQVQAAEDPDRAPEASSTTRAPQEEMVEGTEKSINIASSAFKQMEETIGEEKIEEEEYICRDKIETAPATVMTVETSSGEVQLDDKSARDFDTTSEDKMSVEPTQTALQGEAVNIVKLEDSSAIISQITTAEQADVDKETAVIEMPDRNENEIKELEISNAVSNYKGQDIHICDSGESSTVNGTEKENYEEERNEVLETISEPKYQGVEEVAEADNVPHLTQLAETLTENLQEPSSETLSKEREWITTATTEKIEDESRKKDESPVTENLEGTAATQTKEETCSLDGGTRELEISALELELVESKQNDSLDEAPKETSTAILETMAVEPEGRTKEKLNEENETMDNDISSEQDLGRSSENENIKGEGRAVEDPYQDLIADGTINNLQPYEEELGSASASTAEDQINETPPEPNKEEIMDDINNLKDQIPECPVEQISGEDSKHEQSELNEEVTLGNQINSTQDQIETIKDVIFTEETEQVPVEIQKAKGSEDIKDQIFEHTRELQKKTSSNETVNEITYSDPTTIENPGATYLNVDTKIEDLHAAEDLDGESEVSSIIKAYEEEVKKGTENPLNISNSVLQVSEEERREENINGAGTYYDKEDTPPVPLLTETSVEKVQLDEKFTSQQDEEVERVNLKETSCMVLRAITTELAVVGKEKVIAEKLDTDEVEAGEIKTSDPVKKSMEQDAEDVRETMESLIANRTNTDTVKEEVIEVLKSIPEPINQLEAIIEGDKFPDKTLPSGNITEKHEEPSSAKVPEEQKYGSTSTNENIDYESTKKDETLVKESLEGSFAASTKEDTCLHKELLREVEVSKVELEINGDRMNDSPDEAPKEERISDLEEAMALEPPEEVLNIESTDSPSDNENSMELRTATPCSRQESLKEDSADSLDSNKEIEGLLIVHSAINEILPEELRDKENQIEKANIANEKTKDGVSSEKIADEKEVDKDFMVTDSICIKEMSEELDRVDAKGKTEAVITSELKTVTGSYQDDVAEGTVSESLSQETKEGKALIEIELLEKRDDINCRCPDTEATAPSEENLESVEPREELRSAYESVIDDQINEPEMNEIVGSRLEVDNKETQDGHKTMKDVLVAEEAIVEVPKDEESGTVKEHVNEEGTCMRELQLTSVSDERVSEIIKSDSGPIENLEARDSIEDTEAVKLQAKEDLNWESGASTVTEVSEEDMKQHIEKTINVTSPEFEGSEKMVKEESIAISDANKESEVLHESDADEIGDEKSKTFDTVSKPMEQHIEDADGDGETLDSNDTHRMNEEINVLKTVPELKCQGSDLTHPAKNSTAKLQEPSCEMFPKIHDMEITTTGEMIEDEGKKKVETLVNECLEDTLATGNKEEAWLPKENPRDLQVSTFPVEKTAAVEPQENPSKITSADYPPEEQKSIELRELMHCSSQEPLEEDTLLSWKNKKVEDSLTPHSMDKEVLTEAEGENCKEAPILEFQKHEEVPDPESMAKVENTDAVTKIEYTENEEKRMKRATIDSTDEENQGEKIEEVNGTIKNIIPSKKTTVDMEVAEDFLVMTADEEKTKSTYQENELKEPEYAGEKTNQEREAAMIATNTEELSEEIESADLTKNIQEETMAEGTPLEESSQYLIKHGAANEILPQQTEERKTVEEAPLKSHLEETSDETSCRDTNKEATTLMEEFSQEVERVDLTKDIQEETTAKGTHDEEPFKYSIGDGTAKEILPHDTKERSNVEEAPIKLDPEQKNDETNCTDTNMKATTLIKELSEEVERAGPTEDIREETVAEGTPEELSQYPIADGIANEILPQETKEIKNVEEAPIKIDFQEKIDERNCRDTSNEATTLIEELSEEVEREDPTEDIREETMAEGTPVEELFQHPIANGTANEILPKETKEIKNVEEAPIKLDLQEKGDETNCRDTSTEATTLIEELSREVERATPTEDIREETMAEGTPVEELSQYPIVDRTANETVPQETTEIKNVKEAPIKLDLQEKSYETNCQDTSTNATTLIAEFSEEVKRAGPTEDIQEETMAEGFPAEEPSQYSSTNETANEILPRDTKEGENDKEAPLELDLQEKSDETNYRDTNTEATSLVEELSEEVEKTGPIGDIKEKTMAKGSPLEEPSQYSIGDGIANEILSQDTKEAKNVGETPIKLDLEEKSGGKKCRDTNTEASTLIEELSEEVEKACTIEDIFQENTMVEGTRVEEPSQNPIADGTTTKILPQETKEGKNGEEAHINKDLKETSDETNFGDTNTEATTIIEELSEEVQRTGPTRAIQEEMMAEGNSAEEPSQCSVGDGAANEILPQETKERKNEGEAPIKLDLTEKSGETNCTNTNTKSTTLIEEVNISDIESMKNNEAQPDPLDNDKCTSIRDHEVQSTTLDLTQVKDAAAEEATHEDVGEVQKISAIPLTDLIHETIKAHEAKKEMVNEQTNSSKCIVNDEESEHTTLESTFHRSDITEDLNLTEKQISANKPVTSYPTEYLQREAAEKTNEEMKDENQKNIISEKQIKDEVAKPEEGKCNKYEEACVRDDESHGTVIAVKEGLEISQKDGTVDLIKVGDITKDVQNLEASPNMSDKQIVCEPDPNENAEAKFSTSTMHIPPEQGGRTAKSFNAEAEDLGAGNASGAEPQHNIEDFEEEKIMSDGNKDKEKSASTESTKISLADILQGSTKGTSQVVGNLIEERETTHKQEDQQLDKAATGGVEEKEEEEEQEEGDDKQKVDSGSDAPVMVEASKDMDVKVHKKSHNILSGVGSKVKHSIAKVKKVITGKSSHPKPPSPK